MNPFSNTTNEEAASAPKPQRRSFGSGAEQDRYASHFGIGTEGLERLKELASYKGDGAEQDRYKSHFSLDSDRVRAAADSILHAKGAGAEQDRYESRFGLGNDGWERAKRLAEFKGMGAEQVSQISYLI